MEAKIAAALDAQKKLNILFRADALMHRKKVSETLPGLVEYIVSHQTDDPLVTGFSSSLQNPYKEKSACDLI